MNNNDCYSVETVKSGYKRTCVPIQLRKGFWVGGGEPYIWLGGGGGGL